MIVVVASTTAATGNVFMLSRLPMYCSDFPSEHMVGNSSRCFRVVEVCDGEGIKCKTGPQRTRLPMGARGLQTSRNEQLLFTEAIPFEL